MIINKILNFYLKVLRLESCYKPHNIYIVILILLLTLISVTFRSILLEYFTENTSALYFLFSVFLLYLTFVQFNLLLRITLFQFKGIPFFFKEIKNNKKSIKYFLAYSIYNLTLILASFYIISSLYAFLSLNMSIEIT